MKKPILASLFFVLLLAGCNDPRKKQAQPQPEPPRRVPYAAQYLVDNCSY
jgi:nitrous oxide reductase accessory protein NosL